MIRRGDLVRVSLRGDYGKPRPALVIQSDLFAELDSIVICPITSSIRDAAFRVAPTIYLTQSTRATEVTL